MKARSGMTQSSWPSKMGLSSSGASCGQWHERQNPMVKRHERQRLHRDGTPTTARATPPLLTQGRAEKALIHVCTRSCMYVNMTCWLW